jgi:hypothetical protein
MRKKQLILTLALMMIFGAAQAQVTPEAIIGQTPYLPSVAHLAAPPDDKAASAAISEFHAQIAELRKKMDETTNRIKASAQTAGQADAERIARKTTGRSVSDLQNMSEAEQQAMGQQMAQKQLAAAGFGNMSLSDLQALEGKSDEEIMAAMGMGGMTIGGLTPAELQAMEKMTDAQKAAYMQQGDRMKRMEAAAPTAKQQRNVRSQTRKAQAKVDVVAEMKRITDRWAEIDRLNDNDMQALAPKFDEIAAKYRPEMNKIAAKYFDGKVDATPEEIEAASERHLKLQQAMATENYTLRRSVLPKLQGRIKTKMADVARYDELYAQSMASGGMTATAQHIPSIGFEIARQYLDMTESITD